MVLYVTLFSNPLPVFFSLMGPTIQAKCHSTLLPKKQCAVTELNTKQVCVSFFLLVCICVCPFGQAPLILPVALALNLPPCLGLEMWRDPDSGCGVLDQGPRDSCVPFTLHWCASAWQMRARTLRISPMSRRIRTPIELRHQWRQSILCLMLFLQNHSDQTLCAYHLAMASF